MIAIKATVKARRLELDVPSDWPDGTEVEIQPLDQCGNGSEAMSPEEIARTLAAMDTLEPIDLTDAERSDWERERNVHIEREKRDFHSEAERLRGIWE